jgi:two-component system response regulator VicR
MQEMSNAAAEKILIVDDDLDLTSMLELSLTRCSYQVDIAHEALEGLRRLHAFQPDLILLDVLMPGIDGWDALRRIREVSDVPVLMMSALNGEAMVIRGLDLGADDFLTKPVRQQELRARIQAVLRRAAAIPAAGRSLLHFGGGDLVIDPSANRVTIRAEDANLTATEYKLLLHLARNAGYVLSYNQLLDHVWWGPGRTPRLATLRMVVGRLRRKIEEDPRSPHYVCTQRDSGYYLALG